MKPFRIYTYTNPGSLNRLPHRHGFDHDTLEEAVTNVDKLKSLDNSYISNVLKKCQVVIIHYYSHFHKSKIVKLIDP